MKRNYTTPVLVLAALGGLAFVLGKKSQPAPQKQVLATNNPESTSHGSRVTGNLGNVAAAPEASQTQNGAPTPNVANLLPLRMRTS